MPENERLAILETQVSHGLAKLEEIHQDLKKHMSDEEKYHKAHDELLTKHEKDITTIQTHFAWCKGIWVAVQGSVIGWIGFKH